MAANISVPYTILMDSGIVEGQPPDGPYAIVKFKCLTSDRYQLVQDLIGQSTHAAGTIARIQPFQYPPSPNLICRSIESIEQRGPGFPLIAGTVWIGRKWSIVTAKFGIMIWSFDGSSDPSGQPYTQTTFDIGTEGLTVPQSTYKFSGGVPTGVPTTIQLPLINIAMKRFMMPFAPVAEMAALVGKVNVAALPMADFAFPAQTVLFTGGATTISADSAGNLLYECEYRMTYKFTGWNKFLHPNGTSGFQTVLDGNSNPPYAAGDFSTLP